MSAKQDKRVRREVRSYLRAAGATEAQLRQRMAITLNPKPWWLPMRIWARLVTLVVRCPRALMDGQLLPQESARGD